jgi:hypothetical protein
MSPATTPPPAGSGGIQCEVGDPTARVRLQRLGPGRWVVRLLQRDHHRDRHRDRRSTYHPTHYAVASSGDNALYLVRTFLQCGVFIGYPISVSLW